MWLVLQTYIVLLVDTIKIMQLRTKPFHTDHIDCKILAITS
jgi:hypothetical protein